MSLQALRTHPIRLPLAHPFVTAQRSTRYVEGVLVEAVDEDGRSGWGEAVTTWRVTGESVPGVAAAVAGPLGEAVLGVDPADTATWAPRLAGAVVGNAAARCAVEAAVLDLAARRAGTPLAETLAATWRPTNESWVPGSIRTDMTLSAAGDARELDALVARAVALAHTFGTLKVKVVDAPVTRDVMVEVRRAVGDGLRLRVDANQAWDAATAIGVLDHWQHAGAAVDLVEQPVAAGDLPGMAAVRAAGLVRVVADEGVGTTADVDALARAGAADVVNIKLAKSGGPLQALLVADRALRLGLDTMVGCMMEGTVGLAAAVAVAAVLDVRHRPRVHDLDAGMWLATSTDGPVSYDRDAVVRHPGPGVGDVGPAEGIA